jgi:hypothetical protein
MHRCRAMCLPERHRCPPGSVFPRPYQAPDWLNFATVYLFQDAFLSKVSNRAIIQWRWNKIGVHNRDKTNKLTLPLRNYDVQPRADGADSCLANHVLKRGGRLKVAPVASRCWAATRG